MATSSISREAGSAAAAAVVDGGGTPPSPTTPVVVIVNRLCRTSRLSAGGGPRHPVCHR